MSIPSWLFGQNISNLVEDERNSNSNKKSKAASESHVHAFDCRIKPLMLMLSPTVELEATQEAGFNGQIVPFPNWPSQAFLIHEILKMNPFNFHSMPPHLVFFFF